VEQGDNASDLAYHVNWPNSADPWYVANTTESVGRVPYYGIWGVSAVAVDGDTFIVHEDQFPAAITSRLAIPSHIWTKIDGWAIPSGDSLYMRLRVVADSAFGAGNMLYMAACETYEHWTTPSPNGMTDFYSAMYKMSPNHSGQAFTHSGNVSDTSTYVAVFPIRHTGTVPMRLEHMKFVAWMQNTATKDVLQSGTRFVTPMTFPLTGDTLYTDVPVDIKWSTAAYTGALTLELDRDYPSGTWETVASNLPNTGTANVTITGAPSTNARFRMYQGHDPSIGDTTRGQFQIQSSTTISAVTDPLEGTVSPGDSLVSSVVINNDGQTDAHVVLTPNTGSDTYAVRQSTDPDGPHYAWVDPTGHGVAGPTGDDATTAFTLPWAFNYYRTNYTTAWMCTNGWISFSNPGTNYYYTNSCLPAPGPNTFLAVFWDDLFVTAGTGSCRIWSDTTNQRVIFAWLQTQRYDDRNVRINAEAILYRDGRLEYQYGTMTGTLNDATVGIQNSNASLFSQIWCMEQVPASRAVAFDALRMWARPAVTAFTVLASGSYTLNFYWDGRAFSGDTTLHGAWNFTGNLIPYQLPVVLTVTSLGAHDAVGTPTSFRVSDAYPNPFNPSTSIDYTLEKSCKVRMRVYDITGRQVATVLDAKLDAGTHRQLINAGNWATGVYFVKVNAGDHQLVRKLLLLK